MEPLQTPPPHTALAPISAVRLSDDLKRILDHADGADVTIGDIIHILHGRGMSVLVILFALPFCTPIPLPGLSAPFGLILMLFGLRIAVRKQPWLPKRLKERTISHGTLSKIIRFASYIAIKVEKMLHPRLLFFSQWRVFRAVNGLIIVLCAFILALPVPIPFANMLPATAIALVAAGNMEEDGVAIALGYLMGVLAWAYFILLWAVGKEGIIRGMAWFGF